jgi:hypothetical protein
MKIDCFKLVSECIDGKEVKRPISTLTDKTSKDAVKLSKQYTAGATKDPDPKKLPVTKTPSGIAAGDEKGKVEKELKKIKK